MLTSSSLFRRDEVAVTTTTVPAKSRQNERKMRFEVEPPHLLHHGAMIEPNLMTSGRESLVFDW